MPDFQYCEITGILPLMQEYIKLNTFSFQMQMKSNASELIAGKKKLFTASHVKCPLHLPPTMKTLRKSFKPFPVASIASKTFTRTMKLFLKVL